MKVALAVPRFPPEFLGGTERVARALALALQRQGDEVVVLSGTETAHAGEVLIEDAVDGLRVLRLPRRPDEGYGLDLSRPRLQAVWERVLDAERPAVLHVQHWATLSTGILRAARDRGIATVATLHDLWTACPRFFRRPPDGVHCPPEAGREPCAPCVDQVLHLGADLCAQQIAARDGAIHADLAAADAITVPSRASAERIRRHLPWEGPLHVVPHGLLEPVPADAPRPPGRADRLRVGTFGNLVEEKGTALLIHALEGIEGVECHLYGPFLDPSFGDLVRARAAGFGIDLHCHGAFGPTDPHPALALDLAVFPSLCEESYGLVVEEALARGTPVLVGHRGALRERIGDGGMVVDTDTVTPLTDAIRGLRDDPARLERLRQGIPARFATIDDAARTYRALYASGGEASA